MRVASDVGHLFRFAGLFVLAFIIFLIARHFIVPKSFGQYGHYRAAAIGEIAAHPAKFSGHEACEGCHSDVADKKSKGKHAHVNCEACHGALFERQPVTDAPKPTLFQRAMALIGPPIPPETPLLHHAEDPTSVKPVLPDTKVLCVRCHTASAAKPKNFPQVDPADHMGGAPCETCHQPHSPGMDAAASAAPAAGGAQ